MPEKQTFLTPEGRKKLEDELEYLKTVKRHEVAEQIHSAKEEGDIMENSAYDAAKEQQSFVEGRILNLEQMLKTAVLIDSNHKADIVQLGCTVTVKERGSSKAEEYQIVGSAEADPKSGRISNESPVGKKLMNRKVGDKIEVTTPAGVRYLEIVKIR